jgi:hypothetical protein
VRGAGGVTRLADRPPSATAIAMPVLVTGIQPSASRRASGGRDPGHEARDDI